MNRQDQKLSHLYFLLWELFNRGFWGALHALYDFFLSILFKLKKPPLWGLGYSFTKSDGCIDFLVEFWPISFFETLKSDQWIQSYEPFLLAEFT